MCCVGSGIIDEMIVRSDNFYRYVCVCVCLIVCDLETSEKDYLGLRWAAVSQKTNFNLLTPNDDYSGRTTPLTSKRCILYIYSTPISTEYFKHGKYSP